MRHFLSFLLYLVLAMPAKAAIDYSATKIDEVLGRNVLKILKQSSELDNTTTMRKEVKSVVSSKMLNLYLDLLQTQHKEKRWLRNNRDIQIQLLDRDKQNDSYHNKTFTFYGKGLRFGNLGANTKIKLRARFYLQQMRNDRTVVRSPNHNNFSFLELKIRNPSIESLDSVNKYRIYLRDKDLIMLYKLDPNEDDFEAKLKEIEQRALKKIKTHNGKKTKKSKNDPKLVAAIFRVISLLAKKEPQFIKPFMGISYIRQSKKFIEDHYKSKGRFYQRSKLYPNIEYQITIDKNVQGYKTNPNIEDPDFSFQQYFSKNMKRDLVLRYPKHSRVVELKIPLTVSNFAQHLQSHRHKLFHQYFVKELLSEDHQLDGFLFNKGKANYVKRHLMSMSVYNRN